MHSCPFCDSATDVRYGDVHGHTAYKCQDCGVIFFPRPIETSADYQEYYPYLESFTPARFRWELSIRRRKFRYQLARMRSLRPDAGKLTDVGAGPGYLCKVAADEGWQAQGVETSAPAVRAGQREFGVRYVGLDQIESGSQDVITCHHVLEHIEDPSSFLATLREKLVPEGLLVVHVPNCEPLTYQARNVLFRTRERCRSMYCQLYYPEHITGFDSRSLPAALRRHGFQPLRVRTASMWSRYYDPFFLANYFRDVRGAPVRVNYKALGRQVVQSAAENVGVLVGRGDWVIGHFRAR